MTAMHAIILAGGRGTRLRPRVSDVPKPLASVNGRPFLALQLSWLVDQGIETVALAVHHMADQFDEFVAAHGGRRPALLAIREPSPLGTGGAVANVFRELAWRQPALVINGDTMHRFDLAPLITRHQASGAAATMAVSRVADVGRFGTVQLCNDEIAGFAQATGVAEPGWVNCGAYVISPLALSGNDAAAFSMENELFPLLAARGELAAHVIERGAAFHDIGTPASYDAFCRDQGIAKASS